MPVSTNSTKSQSSISRRLIEMREVQRVLLPYTPHQGLFLLDHRLNAKDTLGQEKPSVRAYFILTIFRVLTGKSIDMSLQTDELKKIIAVGEYVVTLFYLDNHLQDGKFGVCDPTSIQKNREERRCTFQQLDRYIDQEFKGKTQEKVKNTIDKLLYHYAQGMILDKQVLTLENFQRDNAYTYHRLNEDTDAFVDIDNMFYLFRRQAYKKKYLPIAQKGYLSLYLTRSFLINALFFQGFTELLISIFGNPCQNYDELISFSRIYGITQQLVNDICDYIPIDHIQNEWNGDLSTCKFAEDTFSDFRRRLFTLPWICMFNQKLPNYDFEAHFEGDSIFRDLKKAEDQHWILKVLQENGSLRMSMSLVCQLASKGEALLAKNNFPLEAETIFSFARSNRFYKTYLGSIGM